MHVGVHGCRAGWIAVRANSSALGYGVFRSIDELVRFHGEAELILLDIPIGLPNAACPARPCDRLARNVLRTRASSVFSAPCRKAAHSGSIADARAANIAEVGSSLSEQAWGICKKISEVDRFLQTTAQMAAMVRELHPEICFWALNGGRPMGHAKKTKAGVAERLMLLESVDPRAGPLYRNVLTETFRKDVQRDDILDALVGCITAARSVTDGMSRLCGHPAEDEIGLPMEMVYLNWA